MRVRGTVLGVAIVFVAFVSHTYAMFPDASGTVYERSITALSRDAIIGGYNSGLIGPFDAVTRAQAMKMVVLSVPEFAREVQWYTNHPSPIPLFQDTNVNDWYAPYLEVAFKHHIVQGHSDGTFRPHERISAAEGIAMIVRTLGSVSQAEPFRTSDELVNENNAWFSPYLSVAISKNLMMKGQRVVPGGPLMRGQFFDVLYRMREVKSRSLVAYDGSEPPSQQTVQTNTDSYPQQMRHQGASADEIARYLSKKPFAITIPTLGINDLTIATPEDPFSSAGVLKPLTSGLGHLFSTPGQNGKILVYGHSSSYAKDTSPYTKIFRKINKLKPGERVYVTHAGNLYVYEITGHATVNAKDTSPYKPDGSGEQLILYTCWPPDSISQRFLQFGRRVQTVALE